MLVGKVLQPPILLLALSPTFSSSQKSGGREKWLEYLNGSEKALQAWYKYNFQIKPQFVFIS